MLQINTTVNTWIGIDISKDKLDACLLRTSGKPLHKVFDNTADGHHRLIDWAVSQSRHGVRHFCMESTGRYGLALAHQLSEASEYVSVVNPATIKYSGPGGSANKTDKADALKIAHFARKESPNLWEPSSPEIAELSSLVRHKSDLDQDLRRQLNRLQEPGHGSVVKTSIETLVSQIRERIVMIDAEIEKHINDHPDLKETKDLLETIPGVGSETSTLFLAEIPNPKNFDSAQALAAFFGLSPRERQSGKWRGKTTISKTGSSFVRSRLYMPAMSAVRYNPRIKALYERLLAAGKCKMSSLIAAMRKLVMIAYGILKHRRPFDANHGDRDAVVA
jgi:transposase